MLPNNRSAARPEPQQRRSQRDVQRNPGVVFHSHLLRPGTCRAPTLAPTFLSPGGLLRTAACFCPTRQMPAVSSEHLIQHPVSTVADFGREIVATVWVFNLDVRGGAVQAIDRLGGGNDLINALPFKV